MYPTVGIKKHVNLCIQEHAYMKIHTHTSMQAHTHTHTQYTHTHTHTHTHMHTHTHTEITKAIMTKEETLSDSDDRK